MNLLNIPFVCLKADSVFDAIAQQLNTLPQHKLENLLWSADDYKPLVSFAIAHNGSCVFLQYQVEENDIRAVYNKPNDPVYRDSCVEFFISLDNDEWYYNIEFNCIGTCTMGYGNKKINRELIPSLVINNIRSQSKIELSNKNFVYVWEITLVIPANVFIHHPGVNMFGKTCSVNFYKCGDELPQPHFIAWNNLETDEPDFHLPQFFGKALFLTQ